MAIDLIGEDKLGYPPGLYSSSKTSSSKTGYQPQRRGIFSYLVPLETLDLGVTDMLRLGTYRDVFVSLSIYEHTPSGGAWGCDVSDINTIGLVFPESTQVQESNPFITRRPRIVSHPFDPWTITEAGPILGPSYMKVIDQCLIPAGELFQQTAGGKRQLVIMYKGQLWEEGALTSLGAPE